MISLDTLVANAKKRVAAEEAVKTAKEKAKHAKTDSTRRAANEEVMSLQAAIDWHPRALVLRIEEWHCACGSSGRTPGGLFIFSEHARMANTTRLQAPRSESQLPPLPKRVQIVSRVTALCDVCAPSNGFIAPHLERPHGRY